MGHVPVGQLPGRTLKPLLAVLLLGLCAALSVRTWVVETHRIEGESMAPTLTSGQWVLLYKWSTLDPPPQGGEIIAFDTADGERRVKRIIGGPGDRVALQAGRLHLNGEDVHGQRVAPKPGQSHSPFEPARFEGGGPGPPYSFLQGPNWGGLDAFVVPPDALWVLGDNRVLSRDSRQEGPLPMKRLVGRVITF